MFSSFGISSIIWNKCLIYKPFYARLIETYIRVIVNFLSITQEFPHIFIQYTIFRLCNINFQYAFSADMASFAFPDCSLLGSCSCGTIFQFVSAESWLSLAIYGPIPQYIILTKSSNISYFSFYSHKYSHLRYHPSTGFPSWYWLRTIYIFDDMFFNFFCRISQIQI